MLVSLGILIYMSYCELIITLGDCFGEVAFFFSQKQPFTVRTLSICRLLVLKRDGWESLKNMYPSDARLVQQEVARRLRLTAVNIASTAGVQPLGNRNNSSADSSVHGNKKRGSVVRIFTITIYHDEVRFSDSALVLILCSNAWNRRNKMN